MFQILEFVEARLATLTSRSEKHGEDDVPAASMGIEIEAANTLLDTIDPKIRQALYMAVDGQEQLPGVEPSTPVLRCNSFDRHTLPTKYEGWTLSVDDGIDDTTPKVFGKCKLDKFSVEAKQGGSIVLRLRVGTSDLDAERSGMLGMHVGQSIWVKFKAPEKQPDAIDASSSATDLPPDAGSLFAQEHGDDEGGPEDGDTDDEGGIDGVQRETKFGNPDHVAWPFPTNGGTNGAGAPRNEAPPQSVTIERSQPGTRTARGLEKTKAALAAGAKGAVQ
jgi:hypothetical protein